MATTIHKEETLAGLEGGPVVRMRADEAAPFGWGPLWVLVAINVVDRVDANIVAGVLPILKDEWGVSDVALGAIPFAAAIAGMIVAFPAGYWADRYSRTNLLALVLASWAVLTLSSGLAVGFVMFFGIRTLLGAADNIDNPAASSLIADYYPPRARARAFGFQRMAYYAGGAVGVLFGGVVGEIFGWRWAFVFMVVPGLAVAGLCAILREPVRGAIDRFVASQGQGNEEVSAEDAAAAAATWVEEAEGGVTGAAEGTGLRGFRIQVQALLKVRTIFLVYFGLTTLFLGLGGIFFWLPSFFERTRDVGEGAAGGLTALITLFGTLGGAYTGGFVGDKLHRERAGGRILVSGGGLVGGSIVLGLAFMAPMLWLQVVVLAVSVFLLALAIPNLTAAIADVLTANQRGLGFALFTFLSSLGGALGPLMVGLASDISGSLTTAFYFLIVPSIIGSFVVLAARTTFDADAERVLEEARQEVARG
jgi:MFS family permease